MVPVNVPTIQGIPSSLLTIAAWQTLEPSSVIIAEAIRIAGSQSGSVILVTKTSPFLNSESFNTSETILTFPCPILLPIAIPCKIGFFLVLISYSSKKLPSREACTVSGLD